MYHHGHHDRQPEVRHWPHPDTHDLNDILIEKDTGSDWVCSFRSALYGAQYEKWIVRIMSLDCCDLTTDISCK